MFLKESVIHTPVCSVGRSSSSHGMQAEQRPIESNLSDCLQHVIPQRRVADGFIGLTQLVTVLRLRYATEDETTGCDSGLLEVCFQYLHRACSLLRLSDVDVVADVVLVCFAFIDEDTGVRWLDAYVFKSQPGNFIIAKKAGIGEDGDGEGAEINEGSVLEMRCQPFQVSRFQGSFFRTGRDNSRLAASFRTFTSLESHGFGRSRALCSQLSPQ